MSRTLRIRASRRLGVSSPLRYPGGKSALAGLFGDVIKRLSIDSPTYVEPYAGGAGAGIALLLNGIVEKLVINDIDPAVNAFWRAAVEHNEDFLRMVQLVTLSVDEWKRQKEIYRRCEIDDVVALGFSFFYLNRTNRSGVLNAGVIGGQDQSGNYKMDARFNRETLLSRLQAIGEVADRITVSNLDGRSVILRYAGDRSAFLYIDPPYVKAGSQLYLNAFDGRDHAALAQIINGVEGVHWLMTYDVSTFIERLYSNQFKCILELNYSARYPGKAQELLIASPEVADALKAVTP